MKSIEEIQQKNAQRGNLILKAFGQNSPVKYFDQLEKSEQQNAVETIIKAFNEGKIPEEDMNILVKAKYVRRTGSPGNYKYVYKEGKIDQKLPKVGQIVNIEGRGEMEVRAVRGNEIVLAKKGEKLASLSTSHKRFFEKLSGGKNKENVFDYHQRKIEEQNKKMPKPMRDVMNK